MITRERFLFDNYSKKKTLVRSTYNTLFLDHVLPVLIIIIIIGSQKSL